MAITTGWQEVTSGERSSQEFYFEGGRLAYAVTDTASGTPDWDIQFFIDGAWHKWGLSQVDRTRTTQTGIVCAGRYRLHCDTNTSADYTPVKLWWAYCPATLQDTALY